MAAIGMMEGAFFVGKRQLLDWVNGLLDLRMSKVEDCATGAVYCHVADALFPGQVNMKKVNWNCKQTCDYLINYKILQEVFSKNDVNKYIEVDKLTRGKLQDNLEFLQWFKAFFEKRTCSRPLQYTPSQRRPGTLPAWAGVQGSGGGNENIRPVRQRTAPALVSRPERPASGAAGPPVRTRPTAGKVGASSTVPPEEVESMQNELVDLRITVQGLEQERDFYFGKLRDIEILCQANEDEPDGELTVTQLFERVSRILYAEEESADAVADRHDAGTPQQ